MKAGSRTRSGNHTRGRRMPPRAPRTTKTSKRTPKGAAAVGARNVLMDAPELEAWRDALQRARVGPLEWSVALSLEFLKDSIEPARTKLGTGARNYDDATILRTFILLGSRRLEKRHQRGGSIGLL